MLFSGTDCACVCLSVFAADTLHCVQTALVPALDGGILSLLPDSSQTQPGSST